jgi:hypothetical protein
MRRQRASAGFAVSAFLRLSSLSLTITALLWLRVPYVQLLVQHHHQDRWPLRTVHFGVISINKNRSGFSIVARDP